MSETKETVKKLNEPPTPPYALSLSAEKVKSDDKKEDEEMKTAIPKPPSQTTQHNNSLKSKELNNSGRKSRARLSIRRKLRDDPEKELNSTILTFQVVKNKTDQSRVQLLLCNISVRDIFVKLRCSATSNVTALPASSGHIAPKSQMRILLIWKKPEGYNDWKELRQPKLLLTTFFFQKEEKSSDEIPTNTRLMARVSSSKQCDPDTPPIEQLLLDAIGNDTGVTPAPATTPSTAVAPMTTPLDSTPSWSSLKEEPENDDDLEDLRWIIIALVVIIVLLLAQK